MCREESSNDHHNYEVVADTFTLKVSYLDRELASKMQKGVEQGKKDWKMWKRTRNTAIVQACVDRSISSIHSDKECNIYAVTGSIILTL